MAEYLPPALGRVREVDDEVERPRAVAVAAHPHHEQRQARTVA